MKTIKISVFIALAFASQFINAQTQSKTDVERVERANKVALENYASKVGEPVPEVKDYVYGMKLDVAKTIHVSPPVKYCGNVDSYMMPLHERLQAMSISFSSLMIKMRGGSS